MAGHSKWANIKHRKKREDERKGKVFTKLIREISIAARTGGEDIKSNPRLRDAVAKAYANNMTKDRVEGAIKRAVGGVEGQELEEIRYEGYGPGGVAIMVDCMTDNRNRTVGEVRHLFAKLGGNLGTDGSVSYLFTKMGQIIFEPGMHEDQVFEAALAAGADDVSSDADGSILVTCKPESFYQVVEYLEQANLKPANSELTIVAQTAVLVEGEMAEKVIQLIERLEDLDDVQEVYSNADIKC